jgi:hypothetical protein
MAIHASFNLTTGVLAETGDNLGNTITTSRNAAGQIFVSNGAVSIDGGQPNDAAIHPPSFGYTNKRPTSRVIEATQ